MTYRILVVDDHEIVRLGLRTLLSNQPDFTVVDEAGSAEEAVEKTVLHNPDIVVMDIRMFGKNGIDALPRDQAEAPECPRPDVDVLC